MEKEITLDLKDSYILAKIKSGMKHEEKLLSYSQLAEGLSSANAYSSGILPGEYGVKYIQVYSNGDTHYLYTEPASPFTYKFKSNGDRREAQSVRPILVWSIRMYKGNQEPPKVYLYAMKSPIYTGEEKIYQAPFSNVWSRRQLVCWGNTTPILPTQQAIQGLSFTFFNSFENLDLAHNRINRFSREEESEGYLPVHLHTYVEKLMEEGQSHTDVLHFIHEAMMPMYREVFHTHDLSYNDSFELEDTGVMTFNDLIDHIKEEYHDN